MPEESLSNKLGPPHRLHDPEIELMRRLLLEPGEAVRFLDQLDSLSVQEMSDGGMGSLYIVSATKNPEQRRFGQRIAEIQFNDPSGVFVVASLNVDKDGGLYELDVWRTDFSRGVQLD